MCTRPQEEYLHKSVKEFTSLGAEYDQYEEVHR